MDGKPGNTLSTRREIITNQAMKPAKWILNALMIWGAALGFIIFSALGTIREAWRHQGPGFVTYGEQGETVNVAQSAYRRNRFTMGGFMLVLGLSLWVVVAKSARDERNRLTAQGKCESDDET